MKFKTEKELVDWIYVMHLQNTNGRETPDEMFKRGIEAAITELTEFNLFSIPVISQRSELLAFKRFISKTTLAELELYSDEEFTDFYLKANCG